MNLSLPRSLNVGVFAAAIAWTTLSFGAAVTPSPASAAGNTPF